MVPGLRLAVPRPVGFVALALALASCVAESLVPTAAQERAQREAALAAALTGHLIALPGVTDASVVVSLPPAPRYAHPALPRAPSATSSSASCVVAIADGIDAGKMQDAITQLVAAAAVELAAENVTVLVRPAVPEPSASSHPGVNPGVNTGVTPSPQVTQVGPIQVAAGSANLVRVLGTCLLLGVMGLAAWVLWLQRQKSTLARAALSPLVSPATDPARTSTPQFDRRRQSGENALP